MILQLERTLVSITRVAGNSAILQGANKASGLLLINLTLYRTSPTVSVTWLPIDAAGLDARWA